MRRDAKLPPRKEEGRLLKIIRQYGFNAEVFSKQLDKDGELDDENFAKLKRLANHCIKYRKE